MAGGARARPGPASSLALDGVQTRAPGEVLQPWRRQQARRPTFSEEVCSGSQSSPSALATTHGLSSGLRVSLIRALGPWAPSLSTWWTTITPSCTMGIKASQVVRLSYSGSYRLSSLG
nr:transmembrane protein 254 isoform X7 [Macaca fascicularis]